MILLFYDLIFNKCLVIPTWVDLKALFNCLSKTIEFFNLLIIIRLSLFFFNIVVLSAKLKKRTIRFISSITSLWVTNLYWGINKFLLDLMWLLSIWFIWIFLRWHGPFISWTSALFDSSKFINRITGGYLRVYLR